MAAEIALVELSTVIGILPVPARAIEKFRILCLLQGLGIIYVST